MDADTAVGIIVAFLIFGIVGWLVDRRKER